MRAWGTPGILVETVSGERSLTGFNSLKCGVFVSDKYAEIAAKGTNRRIRVLFVPFLVAVWTFDLVQDC